MFPLEARKNSSEQLAELPCISLSRSDSVKRLNDAVRLLELPAAWWRADLPIRHGGPRGGGGEAALGDGRAATNDFMKKFVQDKFVEDAPHHEPSR